MKPKKHWIRKKFTAQRILTSINFSAIVGVTYWATTVYEKAFNSNKFFLGLGAFLLVALVLLLFGGSLLDAMSKN